MAKNSIMDVKIRTPYATNNFYCVMTAMLMAGIVEILNLIDLRVLMVRP